MQGNDIYQLRQLQALQNHDPVSARARAFAKGHAERDFPKNLTQRAVWRHLMAEMTEESMKQVIPSLRGVAVCACAG